MNIRKQLVTWHAIILAGLLLVFTIGLYTALNFHLNAEVDDSLVAWSIHSVESLDNENPLTNGEARFNSEHLFPHFNILDSFALVLSENEKITYNQTIIAGKSLNKLQYFLKSRAPNLRGSYATFILDTRTYRIYYRLIAGQDGSNQKVLVLGRSLMHVRETLSGLAVTLVFAWLVAVIICLIISWIFVGRILYPVKTMTNDALKIAASGELSRRIKKSDENDEFGELSKALNCMLASLEASYIAMKKFLADASHELRTPLTSINANLAFMKRALNASEDEKQAALQDTMAEADRMTGLLNDLLMLARAEAPASFLLEKIDLAEIVTSVFISYRMRQTELIRELSCEAAGPVYVHGDSGKLRQIIVILLNNSIKYSAPGSMIGIKIFRQGDTAFLEVTDGGLGIPESEMKQVFDRFYRASNIRNKTAGSGLGLAIVKSILENHHGKIELRNLKPQGLAVTITLPVMA